MFGKLSMEKFLLPIVFMGLFLLSFTEAVPQEALISRLPGFDGIFPSLHYSGYVNIDERNGKNLFYYFVLSERNATEDPVVLWLNGGPGCSSFDGFVYEHGPFNFQAPKTNGDLPKLQLNPYSWSKVSNIIYLDSPTNVGFSYSDKPVESGDIQTALDTHAFLLKWFELYPEFLSNPLYLSGESYAGIYVPTLASNVVKGINAGLKPVLNFKGYMVGNGVTDEVFDGNAFVPFTHGMGLITDDLFQKVTTACNGTFSATSDDEGCAELINKVYNVVSDLNIYDILEPCYHSPDENETGNKKLPSSFEKLGQTDRPLPVRKRIYGRAWPYRAPVKNGILPSWPELMENVEVICTDDRVATSWLNNEEVKKAIHAKQELTWALCSAIYYHNDVGSMIPYHKNLTAQGYRALIYSGDHDMCVPFTGSAAWTSSLGYKIAVQWRPWYVNDQVAGFIQGYDRNLTFLTIKGAGHTVPEYKPKEALAFYSRWLSEDNI